MIWILSLIVVTSFWVLGLTIVTQKNMLLGSIRKFEKEGVNILDAVIFCPWCMPSIHSAIGYLICHFSGVINFQLKMLVAYPIVVCGSSLVCGLIWTMYEKMLIEKDYYENVEKLSYFDIKDRKGNFQRSNGIQSTQKHKNHEKR